MAARALAAILGRESLGFLPYPPTRHQGRDQVDAFVLHRFQRVVLQKTAVFDRIHAGADGHFRRQVAMAMGRCFPVPGMGFGDDGIHLLLAEFRHIDRVGLRQHPAGGHELDHVGAILDLVAHRGTALIRTVADAVNRASRLDHIGRKRPLVGMSGGPANGVDSRQHTRAFGDPRLDGVTQPDVHPVRSTDIAHRREPGLEGSPGVHGRIQGLLSRKSIHTGVEVLVPVVRHLHGQMHVRVDKARQQGGIAEIDDPRTFGDVQVRAGRNNLRAFHQHHAGLNQLAGNAVEQTRRFEHNRARGLYRSPRFARTAESL